MTERNSHSGLSKKRLTEAQSDIPDNIYAVSVSVGSGKSHAARRYAMSKDMVDRNVVFVCPTVALANETVAKLKELVTFPHALRTVEAIHNEASIPDDGNVYSVVHNRLATTGKNMGAILVVTTPTFLRVCGWLESPEMNKWTVILDEAFSPFCWHEIQMGSKENGQKDNWEVFRRMFQFKEHSDDSNRTLIVPAEGREGQVEGLARKNWTEVGDLHRGLSQLAADVQSPVSETEVVERDDNCLTVGSLTSPHALKDFKEVVILSALFESTILYYHWRQCGVEFKEHQRIKSEVLRDMHEDQGPRLRIGHVLHPTESASRRTVQRDASTGQPKENGHKVPLEKQVIYQAIQQADQKFPSQPGKTHGVERKREPPKDYLLQLNAGLGFDDRNDLLPRRAQFVGADVRGVDEWGHHQCLAAFAVMNPKPQQEQWLRERLNLDAESVRKAFRIHAIYQAVGRLLRDPACTHEKTILTLSKADAEFIHSLFKGSRWIGQVGDLEAFCEKHPGRKRGRRKKSDHPDYDRLRSQLRRLRRKRDRGTLSEEDKKEMTEVIEALEVLSVH